MDLVSIVIPVYNMEESLESCVESILQQDYDKLEIILVDDGSKDNSYDICQKLSHKDERIKAFHTENRGSGPARNYGISVASGKYIFFPDADDNLIPTGITTMVQAIKEDNCDLVVFGFQNKNQNGKIVASKTYEESIQEVAKIRMDYSDYFTMYSRFGIQGAPWNKFFDLELIKKNNIEFPPLRRHQDEAFIARYMCVATRVHFISEILYTYNVNDLQKEWQKYPVDYIDAVKGLYRERKSNILCWNSKDKKTHELVYREYVRGVIRAIELSYAPKMNLKGKARREWICNVLESTEIAEVPIQDMGTTYQNKVLSLIRNKNIHGLCVFLWIRNTKKALMG